LFWRRRIRISTTWRISLSRPTIGSSSPLRARSVRSTAYFASASPLPIAAGAIAPLASPGAALPSVACIRSSGEPDTILPKPSPSASAFTRSNCRLIDSNTLRSPWVRIPASSRCPVRTWCSPNISVASTQPRSIISSMCGEKSEIAVAPRGSRSSAAVMSAAKRDGSNSKWRMMRCRSESVPCRSWFSQCTSSTYGLPRSLQSTVAPSTAL